MDQDQAVVNDLPYLHYVIVAEENDATLSVASRTNGTCRLAFDPSNTSRDKLTATFLCGNAQPIVRELKLDAMRLGLTEGRIVNDRDNVAVVPCADQGQSLINMMVPIEGGIVMACFNRLELESLIADAQMIAAFVASIEQYEVEETSRRTGAPVAVPIGATVAKCDINGMIFGSDNPSDACLQPCLLRSNGTDVTLIFVNEGEDDDDIVWTFECEVFVAGLSQATESAQDTITVSPCLHTFEGLPAAGITAVTESEYGRKMETTVAFPLTALRSFADQLPVAGSLTTCWPDWFDDM